MPKVAGGEGNIFLSTIAIVISSIMALIMVVIGFPLLGLGVVAMVIYNLIEKGDSNGKRRNPL